MTSGFSRHEIEEINLENTEIKYGLPFVFDSSSLAFTLGIRNKTLWWLINANTYKQQKNGDGMYKYIAIPKKSGGVRHLHEPMEALKNVQKVLLKRFLDPIPAPEYLGAYVPGRALSHTYEQHTGKETLISTDIKNFFPSITRYRVSKWLEDLGYNDKVQNYVSNLVCVPIKRRNPAPNRRPHIYVLPQGAPTSSALSNHVMRRWLDEPFLAWLSDEFESPTYTRYADNLEISFDERIPEARCQEILDKLDAILARVHMHRHPSKTRIRYPTNKAPMRVLGVSVQEHANIPRSKYKRLRGIVHDIWTKGLDRIMERTDLDAKSVEQGMDILRGRLLYWSSVNEDKLEDTREKFQELEERLQKRLNPTPQTQGNQDESKHGSHDDTDTSKNRQDPER